MPVHSPLCLTFKDFHWDAYIGLCPGAVSIFPTLYEIEPAALG